jgi:hypothetical protein
MDSETNINALGLVFMITMGVLTLILPRKYAPVPIMITGAYMTLGQIIIIFGLHFTMMRIMILFGCARLIIRQEIKGLVLDRIDKAFLLWVLVFFVIFNLREMSTEAFINRLGVAYNALGFYFFFRFLIREPEEILFLLKALAILIIPLALLMLMEKSSGRNMFFYFGGVPEYTVIREDSLRCQGPFRHAILAGTFGATALPLLVGLWIVGREKLLVMVAMVSALVIIVTAASSGPLMSCIAGIIALCAWKVRELMRPIRWAILISLISLQLIMKAPVWFLIDRLSDIIGGTGWHRAELINQAIMHFNDWWLLGTNYTGDWMPYNLRLYSDSADITNQYIAEGVTGGLLSMLLFIAVIVLCFKKTGMMRKALESGGSAVAFLPWALGSALFAHVVAFIAVSYFDQMVIYWNLLLAMIAALTVKNYNRDNKAVLGNVKL